MKIDKINEIRRTFWVGIMLGDKHYKKFFDHMASNEAPQIFPLATFCQYQFNYQNIFELENLNKKEDYKYNLCSVKIDGNALVYAKKSIPIVDIMGLSYYDDDIHVKDDYSYTPSKLRGAATVFVGGFKTKNKTGNDLIPNINLPSIPDYDLYEVRVMTNSSIELYKKKDV